MNQQSAPFLGVIARGGAGATDALSMMTVVDPAAPTWAVDLFRSHGATGDAIVFVPELERSPRVGQGTQLDELLPEQSPHVAVVTLPTHVTGILAAVRDCVPRFGHRAELIAAVRAHVADSYAGVWLRRVGRLESPSPSFGQHLGSWWPFGGGYFAALQPVPAVRRRLRAVAGDDTPRVLRTSSAPARRTADALRRAYGAQDQEVLAPPHRLVDRWGTDRAMEYVASPHAASLRLPVPEGRCPACGDPIWGRCAFCHLVPPRLQHWLSVSVPGVTPLVATPEAPAPAARKAFQLPRHRPKADSR